MISRARVLQSQPADENNSVVTVQGGAFLYCKKVCAECPWRKDSKIGAFPAQAYRLSAHTAYDMSESTFACHMAGKKNPAVCAGFLYRCHHNLTVRMAYVRGQISEMIAPKSNRIPLYRSYKEMAVANGVDPKDPVLRDCR